MSNEELRSLLAKLRVHIQDSEFNDETQQLLHELDADIHDLIGVEHDSGQLDSVMERAQRLEAEFDTTHPVLAQSLKRVMNILSAMGI